MISSKSIEGSGTWSSAVAVAVVLACASASASAQEPRRGFVLEHDGQPGIWLSLDAHRLMLADLKELPEQRKRVVLLEKKLQLREADIADLRALNEVAEKATEKATGALTAAVRGKREAEESRDAWHRNRLLWFGIGFASAFIVSYAVIKIIDSTSN